MKVTLLDRTEAGQALTETMDLRGGKTIDDAADEIRAIDIGRSLLDWWTNGSSEWTTTMLDCTKRPPVRQVLDLRACLKGELGRGGRISCSLQWLILDAGVSSVKPGAESHHAAIGRDLIAWWQENAASILHDGRSVACLLNDAFRRYWKRVGRHG